MNWTQGDSLSTWMRVKNFYNRNVVQSSLALSSRRTVCHEHFGYTPEVLCVCLHACTPYGVVSTLKYKRSLTRALSWLNASIAAWSRDAHKPYALRGRVQNDINKKNFKQLHHITQFLLLRHSWTRRSVRFCIPAADNLFCVLTVFPSSWIAQVRRNIKLFRVFRY